MSLRNLKKMTKVVPDDYGDSSSEVDEVGPLELVPHINYFAQIALSDRDSVIAEESDASTASPQEPPKDTKKDKKKKKNGRKNKRMRRRAHDLNEVERSVNEVNELLGIPVPPAEAEAGKAGAKDARPQAGFEAKDIFALDVLKLNADNEMNKMFGPLETERPRNRGRVPNLRRIHKAVIIADGGPPPQESSGLSMKLMNIDGFKSYCFKHNKAYREIHSIYLQDYDNLFMDLVEGDRIYTHAEANIDAADFLFEREQYNDGNAMIKKAIYKMQCAFHPLFRLSNPENRLLYRYIENRAFHIAMLKYIHLLTNRACHETALELTKMLMNLDPTDPLGLIFIVDMVALRAEQYDWLIRAVDFWKTERSADDLFNIKYSYALAQFHVAARANGDKSKANMLLQDAILSFPLVALDILEIARPGANSKFKQHSFFSGLKYTFGSARSLRDLYTLYAQFTNMSWSEPQPLQWLQTLVEETVKRLDEDPVFEAQAKVKKTRYSNIMRAVPIQILRHLCIIKPMARLLVDGGFPEVPMTRLLDPLPITQETIDIPKYTTQTFSAPPVPHAEFIPPYAYDDDDDELFGVWLVRDPSRNVDDSGSECNGNPEDVLELF